MSAAVAPRVSMVDLFEATVEALDRDAPYWSEDFESEDVWRWITARWPKLRAGHIPVSELARQCLEALEQEGEDDDDAPLFV